MNKILFSILVLYAILAFLVAPYTVHYFSPKDESYPIGMAVGSVLCIGLWFAFGKKAALSDKSGY